MEEQWAIQDAIANGMGKRVRRRCARRVRTLRLENLKRKRGKAFGCSKKGGEEGGRGNRRARVGVWNVRKLGSWKGKGLVDEAVKLRSLVDFWGKRKWKAVMLSEVGWLGRGVRTIARGGKVWTIVHSGRVAVALDPEWTMK